jgi:hypothetical protein
VPQPISVQESGAAFASKQLLRIARLRRDRERWIREVGPVLFGTELADCCWGVYQMLGKLCPRAYVLERPWPRAAAGPMPSGLAQK